MGIVKKDISYFLLSDGIIWYYDNIKKINDKTYEILVASEKKNENNYSLLRDTAQVLRLDIKPTWIKLEITNDTFILYRDIIERNNDDFSRELKTIKVDKSGDWMEFNIERYPECANYYRTLAILNQNEIVKGQLENIKDELEKWNNIEKYAEKVLNNNNEKTLTK